MKNLIREDKIFQGSANGKTATYDGVFSKPYTVEGSYMDCNGCMKTYGKDTEGNDQDSFIIDTEYN